MNDHTPNEERAKARATDSPSKPDDADLRRSNATVLVVDDSDAVRNATTAMLAACGFGVVAASSGEEAVDFLEGDAAAVDVVLLDLTMPGWSGRETFQQIRRIDPSVPIVLMSGFATETPETGPDGRCFALLAKPFHLDQLVDVVDRAVDSTRLSSGL